MKKVINNPDNYVDEAVEGVICAYGDKVRLLNGDKRILLTNYPVRDGKVGIVTAGGFGHLPVFLGYVGQGMLDGCAIGNVFASPSSHKMSEMIKACDYGNGVLCLYGNYGGDKMNFEIAREVAQMNNTETRSVIVKDDVASSPADMADKRRGVAGMVYAFKIAGAAAEQMMNLDDVVEVTEHALSNIRTIGVALSPCVVPQVGKPTFSIDENEIEIGMGIHGEPGIEVRTMMTADEITTVMLERILADMPLVRGDEASVMVNGLGATPLEELLIVYRKLHMLLGEIGVSLYMPHIGEFATSMEMAGFSITVMKLDDQLKALLRAPGNTPFYSSFNK
ncbi:MAG: dihydroxyacetone kinase subunit DhaK [Bacillota bacterium]|nr:dihydroxyacetone kinase subunit DhaK [Bacillota bacterium]MDD3851570.1 dihydroxyacetone kinase subunit DhaK [Bacillota bacterium]MDD4707358.1 dihydroxyacetone kinase subunit DhaK [Bacillota bacterium]